MSGLKYFFFLQFAITNRQNAHSNFHSFNLIKNLCVNGCLRFVGLLLYITDYNAKFISLLSFSLLNAECFRLHDGYLGGISTHCVAMNENYPKHI